MQAAPVLDSFALLAFLRGEAGDEQVAALLEKASALAPQGITNCAA